MELTRFFKNISKEDIALAGGKGASLGEMTQADIPVPPGFVVLVDAFERFLDETELNEEIQAQLDGVNHHELETVERASKTIRSLILNSEMPQDIQSEILSSFEKLDAQYVAVRSSATAEDGANASWAGELESYLNTTHDSLLEKVKLCWSSLFTPRAIFYRIEKGFHKGKVSVAVVVQKMVNSEISGIAFSVHPVTEDPNQLIIEAGYGLGEAIVSGSVTPDNYVIDKRDWSVVDTYISQQERQFVKTEGGGSEWVDIEPEKQELQKLPQEKVIELAKLVVHIEQHYGFPCDIEWALEEGKLYIVQSRPITTLTNTSSEPPQLPFNSPELIDFTPDDYHFDGLWKNDLFATCFWQDCWLPEVVEEMSLDLHGVGVMNLKGGHYFVSKSARAKIDTQIKQMVEEKNEEFFKHLVTVSDKIFTWAGEKGKLLSSKEPTLENFRDFVCTAKKLNFVWLIGASYFNWPVEEKLQEAIIEDEFPAEHVLDILPKIGTPLTKYQQGLIKLKEAIGSKTFSEVEKDHELFEQLRSHAEKYAWVEVFNFIGEPLTPKRLYSQIEHLPEEKNSHAHVFVTPQPLSVKLIFATKCMHSVGYIKQGGAEYFSIFTERVLPFLKEISHKIGVDYREMMCLSVSEIDQALQGELGSEELKKKAAHRIGVNDWALIGDKEGKTIFVEDVADIKLLMEKMVPKTGEGTKELIGQVGNRGKYTGPVRVVMNTYDFDKLVPGDVLVTTMTTPDFIVIMQKSGAVVTDIGGLLCHAAIVSRELQKPCVIGTKFATQILRDGDMVEVDADKGEVHILNRIGDSKDN